MKNQALFSSKDKNKNLKCCLLQFLCGALGVKFSPTVDFSCPLQHMPPLKHLCSYCVNENLHTKDVAIFHCLLL